MPKRPSASSSRAQPTGGAAAAVAPMREFSRSLPMALLRTREAVMRHFRPTLREHGLTEQQWRILRALTSVTEAEVTELARIACLLGPSLSRILRDLEARGLITRRTVVRDQRRGTISITSRGNDLIAQVAPLSETIYAQITERYGEARLAALHAMLTDLERDMRVLEGDAESDGAMASEPDHA